MWFSDYIYQGNQWSWAWPSSDIRGRRWWLKRSFHLIIPVRVWEWDHKAGWICSSSKLCEWQQHNGFTPSGTAFRRRSWSAGWRTNRFTQISDGFCIRPTWRRYCLMAGTLWLTHIRAFSHNVSMVVLFVLSCYQLRIIVLCNVLPWRKLILCCAQF